MKKFKDRMNEIKVDSYKDCVWYLEDIDKCEMSGAHGEKFECHCKKEMDDFCIWITKFFKSTPDDSVESWDVILSRLIRNYDECVELNDKKESSFLDITKRFVSDVRKKISI
jgi:hypothetical protein